MPTSSFMSLFVLSILYFSTPFIKNIKQGEPELGQAQLSPSLAKFVLSGSLLCKKELVNNKTASDSEFVK